MAKKQIKRNVLIQHGLLKPAGGGLKAVFKWAALIVVLIIVGGIALFALLAAHIYSKIETFDLAKDDIEIASIDGAYNILLIGSDTRENQGEGFTASDKTSALADVIILISVSENHNSIIAVSFPRDLMVAIPQCKASDGTVYSAQSYAQINSSLSYAGASCTVATVESITGVDIDYAALIDFKGVIEMTNIVGGVDVCVTADISDPDSGLYLTAGEHTIQGSTALAFLRNRHGVGDGSDLGRISSQQSYLSSLIRKLKSDGTLSNPFTLYDIAVSAANNLTLSSNLSNISTMLGVASVLNSVELDEIAFIQLPVVADPNNSNRVVVDQSLAPGLFDAIKSGAQILLSDESSTGRGAVEVESNAEEISDQSTADSSSASLGGSGGTAPQSFSEDEQTDENITVLSSSIIGQKAEQKTCAVAN